MLSEITKVTIRTSYDWSRLAIPRGADGEISIANVFHGGKVTDSQRALLVCLATMLGRQDEAPGDFATAFSALGSADQFAIASVFSVAAKRTLEDEVAAADLIRRI